MRLELRVRGAQLKSVPALLRRHILGCPWIDLRVRRMLALSLVLSKGRTTWVAWPTLCVRDYNKVQVDYNNVWRGVLRANICAGPPEQILARVDALDATLARRVDRLQYLRRLVLRAPEVASILCNLGVPLPLPIIAPLPSDAGPPCLPASTIQFSGNVAFFGSVCRFGPSVPTSLYRMRRLVVADRVGQLLLDCNLRCADCL